jgi:virginiamycin B lyase
MAFTQRPQRSALWITHLNGAIWYSESNVSPNTLVRFDLKTEQFQSWPIPSGGGVVRNMMSRRKSASEVPNFRQLTGR